MLSAIRAPSIPSTAVEICARAAPHLVREKKFYFTVGLKHF